MDSGLYSAYTALLARTDTLDLAANNLANVSTAGFHAGRAKFRHVLSEAQDAAASQVGSAVNGFSLAAGQSRSDLQGAINATGNKLDLAISGEGYFAVQTPAGTRYTRNGQLQISAAGTLTTRDGNNVLGADSKPIHVPSGDISISVDGTLSVGGPDGSAIAGKVGLFNVADLAPGESGSLLRSDAPAIVVSEPSIQQGALEGSDQDAIQGTVQLITVQRQAEMMQRALSIFHNDFDKTASEELARVS